MSMTDSIADMLTRIRNAQKAKLINTSCPHSVLKEGILSVMIEEGYICGFHVNELKQNIKNIEIALKYSNSGESAIKILQKVSKPGKRIYSNIKDLPEYFNGMGVFILSTSSGVISDRHARKIGVGGEVICKIF